MPDVPPRVCVCALQQSCRRNRKLQCKMRQRSSRSERRKMALPSVARRIKAFLANSDRNLIQNGQRSLRQQAEVIRAEPQLKNCIPAKAGQFLYRFRALQQSCRRNRKPQCKMRQRSLRSERRKMALPSVARRSKLRAEPQASLSGSLSPL